MKRKLSLLLALITLLMCGCAQEEEGPALGSQVWQTPQLTYGVMEYEKLQVLPWNSGRCEATSFGFMAESKMGYYTNAGYRQMLYADKSDLSNWVPLCNKPNCGHVSMDGWSLGQIVCNSEIWGPFTVRDGRIWYIWGPYGKEYEGIEGTQALMSMAPDGSDKRIECMMGTTAHTLKTDGAYANFHETLYNMVEITADGSWVGHCYRVVDGKLEEYATKPLKEEDYSAVRISNAYVLPLYGEPLVDNGLVCPTKTSYLRYLQEGYEILELGELPASFSFLSGDVLRFFRPGDGYYDINIRTGEEVKLADPCMENSHAVVALPNCILESTLMTYHSLKSRTPGQTHSLMLFDGERWREVELPPELQVTDTAILRFVCVTSDSIFLRMQDTSQAGHIESGDMYRIDLTKRNLKLEFFTQLKRAIPCK